MLVVNDPASLANAVNKTYFQHFPEVVRPRTLISRDAGRDRRVRRRTWVAGAVLKPLQGSGGSGVFLVSSDESPNLNQMIEAIARDGYVVAQEFLPEAEQGDVRMFVMNGEPLVSRRQLRRLPPGQQDGRHPLEHARRRQGRAGRRSPTRCCELVDAVRPKLLADGMFLVGLDIVGDKLMEVNVFSPGGLGSCESLYEVNFARPSSPSWNAR